MTAAAKRIDRILTRLRDLRDPNLQDPNGVDIPPLERIIQNFEQLQHSARSIYIGFFGPSGSGKSTLMNRILGVEILPAYSSGQSCTNAIIKISPKAEQDGQFEIIIDYFDNGELAKLLQFKAPSAVEEDAEDIEDDTEESEDYLVAQEILKALWDGEEDGIPLHPKYVLDLLPPGLQADFRQRGRRVVRRFSNPAKVSDYLEQVNDQEKIPYLVKNIEVRGYFEDLDAQICLLDIPGSGDTKFLSNLQRQGLDQSDLVVFVETQARVRNEDVMRRLGKYSDRFERKVGFAFCMTGAGEGLIDHCKKRMRRDPAAGADQGDEYVENQKELFKAKVEKVDRGTLSCKLVGMEIFVLENKGDDEPEFSKAERAKLNEFLHRMAKTDASWRLVDGNVDAAVEDAKSRLNPPPGIKLDHETSQEIQSILHDNSIKPDFFKHAGVPSMDLDKVKAPAYRNTLKNPASVLVNYYPTIPIWSHIVSCIVDTTKVTTNLKHFETHYLEQVNDKLDSIRQVLHRRFPEDEVRDFCFFRIKSLMFGSVIADLELSTRLMKGSALENAVAVEFWSQLPMVSKGKGMVAANQQKICVFLNSIGDQAKHLLEDRMQQEFFTLDHALKRASDVVADESSWLPVVDKNIASQRLILNALEGIDEVEEEEPTVDRQKEKLKLRDQFLQRIQDEFPDHCVSFSGRKPPRLTKPKLPVVAGRFSVILDLTDSDRVKVSSEGQESGEVFGQPTKLPQLCTRLMTCLFEQTLVISPKRKYVFIRANAEVVKAVAELVHTFVERLCVIWDIK